MPDTLHPITKANQIEQTVVVQAVQSVEELHWLLKIADENPFITGVVGWVDLKDKNVSKTLETVVKHPKLKGIRHVVQEEPDDNWLLQEDVISGLKDVASFNLTYDVLIVPRHMKSVPILAEKIPDFGGDTLFASMSAAFEGLSDKMRSFLSGLTAIHDFSYGFKESLAEPGGRDRLKQAVIDNPPVYRLPYNEYRQVGALYTSVATI